jgi:hypothetical protein
VSLEQGNINVHVASAVVPGAGQTRSNGVDVGVRWATTPRRRLRRRGGQIGSRVVVHVEPIGPTTELGAITLACHGTITINRQGMQ